MKRGTAVLLLSVVPAAFAPVAISAQDLTLSGQLRPRFEFVDPAVDGSSESFTAMRSRVSLQAAMEHGLTVFMQLQDVRTWGSETSTVDFSADGFDLHQGYLRLTPDGARWLTATAGRMELDLGGQRLVGAIDWRQQAQSFDGLTLDLVNERMTWTTLALTINDGTAPGVPNDRGLYGAYGTVHEIGSGALDAFWLYDRGRGAATTNEHFFGGRFVFEGAISARAEATISTGTRADADVTAYMFGIRAGTDLADGRIGLTLWYDYLSADDPSTPEVEVFNTLFATNHKFYGFADLFLNIPENTGGAGLQDAAVKLLLRATDRTNAGLDLHSFWAGGGAGLTSSHYGEEIDLTLNHRYSANLLVTGGMSYVMQRDGLSEIGRLDENLTTFYVMVNATF